MAYNIKVKFEDSWIWILSGSDKATFEKAIFKTKDEVNAFVKNMNKDYYIIVEVYN